MESLTSSEKNTNPLISINICTHNRADLIEKAIQSALDQTFKDYEIVIVDNGDDKTEKIVNKISAQNPDTKIKYFKTSLEGINKNRNFALQKSTGKYIAVLDSDDYWLSTYKLSKQVEFLEENNDYALVGTNAIVVDSQDKHIDQIINQTTNENIRQNLLLKNHFVHSSVVFKKDALNKYDEEIFIWEDYEAFLRIARAHKVANLAEFMTAYKKHANNISAQNRLAGVKTLSKIIRRNKKYCPNYYWAVFKNWGRFCRALLPL